MLTLAEVKKAVDEGKTVFADTQAYRVIKERGEYKIICLLKGFCVGLHGREGTKYADKMNGKRFWSVD